MSSRSGRQVDIEVFCLNKYKMYNESHVKGLSDSSNQLVQIVREHCSPPAELMDEVTKYGDALDLFHDREGQQEVAVNATLVNVLQKSIFSDFVVQLFSTAMVSRNICKYAASRQDIVIYHQYSEGMS